MALRGGDRAGPGAAKCGPALRNRGGQAVIPGCVHADLATGGILGTVGAAVVGVAGPQLGRGLFARRESPGADG
ncbi:hypothetical protein DESC_370190 [Desulfosarcina cetonica]|nr:hypothetical protein DESC_370190 [Desulfosarcina cetonica]